MNLVVTGSFLSCEAESFLSDIVRYAFNLYDDAAGSNGATNPSGAPLRFTHADLGRLLCDGFVGEDANPDLTLTLHVAGNSDTGGFNLATGDPLRLKVLMPNEPKANWLPRCAMPFMRPFARGEIWFSWVVTLCC